MCHDEQLERYRVPVGEYITRCEDNLVEFERVRRRWPPASRCRSRRSSEYAATIVNSMVTGEPSVVYGNVPNTGLISELPDGTCVEVPCVVEQNGLRPTQVPDYPPQLAALNRTYANVVELTVRAVLEERPDYVRIAALLDPNTSATLTLDEVDALCDELTLAHGELIPAGLRGSGVEHGSRSHERDHARPGHEGLSERRARRSTTSTSRSETASSCVLVGPSGCGKSTLLRMIAGLEDVTDGAISIGDADVTDKSPQQRDIAMVFQNYALYPHMTVRENLAYGLKLRKLPKAEWKRRVDETARTLGLEELLDRKPSALSGGQRQRVAMGRAIVREPKAFLMDEPLSNLDAKLRVSMRAELAKLHERLRRDDGVRDARPGRGDDARAAGRGAPGRPAAASRHPAEPLPRAREPLRRRVHRVAVDEPDRRGRREPARLVCELQLRAAGVVAGRRASRGV